MNKAFFLFFLVPQAFFFSSCWRAGGGSLNSKVTAFVALPHTRKVRPSGVIIHQRGSERQQCRPRPLSSNDLRKVLKDEGLNEETIDYFLGEEDTEEENIENPNDPVYTSVGEYWIRFGLFIQNRTNFPLVIDYIHFNARASCGNQSFSHSGEVNSGYCSEEGDVASLPFIYFIPPNAEVPYEPTSSHPLKNLTIFLDGFRGIDRRGDPSQVLAQKHGEPQTRGGAGVAALNTGQVQECRPNDIIYIPTYTVELTLSGYFITQETGERTTSHFSKRVSFKAGQVQSIRSF